MVPGAGLEPAHCRQRQILSLMRLPISPPGLIGYYSGLNMLRTDDFDYELPEALIAQTPAERRGASRLLVLRGVGDWVDSQFAELPRWVRAGDLLVFNDTRVVKARLKGRKLTGGQVECLVERVLSPHEAWVQFRASHAPQPGGLVLFDEGTRLRVLERSDALFLVRLESDEATVPSFWEWMDRQGDWPLPPYITRTPDEQDALRYQTVYAQVPGAVAAPTAGLHFDWDMLGQLESCGVGRANVTLHVGAGTFQPVRSEYLKDHMMHEEHYHIPRETVEAIERTRRQGGKIIAVGTTSLRALESAWATDEAREGTGETRLFITPGYQFRVVDRLLTNFHLPRSTLLMLISAFAGMESVRQAYRHAVEERYRFFSYGDAMLLDRCS